MTSDKRWSLAPSTANPCWAFPQAKHFELACDHAVNPNVELEESWLASVERDAGFELPLDSPGYPADVRPGMTLRLVTPGGVVERTVAGVSAQPAVRENGWYGLRYTIRLDGVPVGPALALSRVDSAAKLSGVVMVRPGPTAIAMEFVNAMRVVEGPVPVGTKQHADVLAWSDPLDSSLGTFAAVTDEFVTGNDDLLSFVGLGYSVAANAGVRWIVHPDTQTEAVSIEHAVDLDGDGSNELLVRVEFGSGEQLLLVRRADRGFAVQEIYSLGC